MTFMTKAKPKRMLAGDRKRQQWREPIELLTEYVCRLLDEVVTLKGQVADLERTVKKAGMAIERRL